MRRTVQRGNRAGVDHVDSIRHAAVLRDYFGKEYLEIYADVKQAEFDAFMGDILERELEWYL